MWLSPNNSKYKCAIFCILQIVVSKNEEYCLHFTNVEPWGSVPIDIVLSLFIIVQNYKYEWKYRMSSKGKTSCGNENGKSNSNSNSNIIE